MPSEDDFDLAKYILQLSKKIAQLTKDYVGLPFNNQPGQLPFSLDARPGPRSKYFGTTRKWQRGDPLIGFYTPRTGLKKMILNLPDGSTMLDLCFPGWEVAVIDESAMDHFYARRSLFGDMYGHLLNGRPLPQTQSPLPSAENDQAKAAATTAAVRQAEIFNRRRVSLQKAAEEQQRRGVPFDAHPEREASVGDMLGQEGDGPKASYDSKAQDAPRKLYRVSVASQSVRDSATGLSRNRLVIQKTYNNGETETIDKSQQGKVLGELDCDVEQLLASQLFNVFISPTSSVEQEASERSDKDGQSDGEGVSSA